ncbi:MAG: hypothetical protein N2511_01910 [Thermodesulfovibrionales bacterium]|nr:hypothetical protein [Thermodesulfovibrionales bacterium]
MLACKEAREACISTNVGIWDNTIFAEKVKSLNITVEEGIKKLTI